MNRRGKSANEFSKTIFQIKKKKTMTETRRKTVAAVEGSYLHRLKNIRARVEPGKLNVVVIGAHAVESCKKSGIAAHSV